MRKTALLSLLLTLATGLSLADTGDDTLKFYLAKSDLVVIGKITNVSGAVIKEAGVPQYGVELKVADVLKGDAALKTKTIRVCVVRFEMSKKDKHPLLKKDAECILFLKKAGTKENPAWQTADMWFALQHSSPWMAKSLKRLATK